MAQSKETKKSCVSTSFKNTIKKYLERIAVIDDNFAKFYENSPSKSIDECCEYIVSQAKANGCAGYSDEEVFGWAIHYWEEADLKVESIGCQKVVVNHHVDLTEEEIDEARKAAIAKVQRDFEEKMTKKQMEAREEAARARDERAKAAQARKDRNKRIFTIVIVAILIIGLSFPTMALVVMGGGQ